MGIVLRDAATGEIIGGGPVEREAVAVEMWYDRSRRNWVLYPVSAEGYQLQEARYAFGKREAVAMRKDMESELVGNLF